MSQHFSSNTSLDKELVRVQLVALVRALRTRPVTVDDISEFRRFAVPYALHAARGRPLTEAEARATIALLVQPRIVHSVRQPAVKLPNYTQCECPPTSRNQDCHECSVAHFVDYKFSNVVPMRFPPLPSERTGIINNPPFSIFAKPGASVSNGAAS